MNSFKGNPTFDYPKSSCNCYQCASCEKILKPAEGRPSNMSTPGCSAPPYFECFDKSVFKTTILPDIDDKYIELNPEVVLNAYDQDFRKYECTYDGITRDVYASNDPRLISIFHNGQLLTLDVPPQTDGVKLADVYDDKLTNYGQKYKGYEDVNAGQISYYVDKSISEPFFQPIFARNARMFATLYQDPMGSMKPQYDRQPLNRFNPIDTKNRVYYGGLSWIEDSCESREDIISRQMRKTNQQKYSARWF